MVHGRPGPAPQTEKREWFARLIAHGTSNAEACRIVGVDPRTGKSWRHGRTITSSSGRRLHYPAVINTRTREISPRYLSEEDRVRIADLQRHGLTVRAIAAALDRSPATISRELRRNRDPGSGQDRPVTAQRLAATRRTRPGRGKLVRDAVLREFVQERLEKRWSPEQICQAIRTGLRWGKATGLRVRDVDLNRRRLDVRCAFADVEGQLVERTPKSHQTRTVPLPPWLCDELRPLVDGRDPDALVATPQGRVALH